jgi:pimeloyl-ACP methyl ester carboxylesterase
MKQGLLNSRLVVLLLVVFAACQQENQPPEEEASKHFISAVLVKEYAQTTIKLYFDFAAQQYPEAAHWSSNLVSGAQVYYVEYSTSYVNDQEMTASGLICIPDNVSMSYPVVSFQNGTNVKHSSAPTENLTDEELILLHGMAGLGFVVVVADYIGFGSTSDLFHPYLYKPLFESAVVDLLKALTEWSALEESPVKLNGQLFLTGYSLGGWATLLTHQSIEQHPINGLTLVGSACGAGSYNLESMQPYLFEQTDYPQPFYVPFLVMGYQSVGALQSDLSLYFSEPYATRIPTLFDGAKTSGEINAQLTTNMLELLSANLLENYATGSEYADFRDQLYQNSIQAWENKVPISFYHGTADLNVPFFQSEQLVNAFRALGQDETEVSFYPIQDANHETGVLPMFVDVVNNLIAD